MKQKKAMVRTIIEVVLTIIVLVLLIILLVKIIPFGSSDDETKAIKILKQIKVAMENAKTENIVTLKIYSPKDWYILSFDKDLLKEYCTDGRCLCICEEQMSAITCMQKNAELCDDSGAKVTNNENSDVVKKISPVPYYLTIKYNKDTNSYIFYSFNYFATEIDTNLFQGTRPVSPPQPGLTELPVYTDPVVVSNIILTNNPKSSSLLYWNPTTQTNFAKILIEKSNSKKVNPLLVMAVLKEQHNIIEVFENTQTGDQKQQAALKINQEVVFEKIQKNLSPLLYETIKEDCKMNYNVKTPQETYDALFESTIGCIASALNIAITTDKYVSSPEKSKPYAVISWYSGSSDTTEKIVETYMLYTH